MKRIRKNHGALLNLPTLRLEGGLFLPDQLEKAALGRANLQTEADYRIPAGLKLKDEFSRAFQIASAQWKHFAPNLERQDIDSAQVTVKFVQDLLRDALSYQPVELITGLPIGDRNYPITALAGGSIPVVIAPHNQGLDEPDPRFAIVGSGARKKSPFQLAQEFLNASGQHLWALVTNGKQLRLLRDAASLTRPSFLEFDLQDMLDGQRFAEFGMAWRILHASRAGINDDSIWEAWRNEGQREGTRVRDGLRQGVTDALLNLGNGFIEHPANESLRLDLLEGRLSKEEYFQQLLRLVYRFIFLFTVEERGVLHTDDNTQEAIAARKAYAEGYALSRLRDRCLRRRARNVFDDHWQALRIVFRSLAHGEPRLALPALGGLFADNQCPNLDAASLSNAYLLDTIKQLRWSNISGNLAPVDYRNMGTEELGSVYESLLELVPEIDIPARQFGFVGLTSEGSTQGNARKTSGSYYTPDSLVQELIKSALDPVIEDRLSNQPKPIDALLDIKVIDPACGSGHFLLAAARRLAERLAVLRAPEGAVRPQDYRHALREVISKCIFGVDRNPMAIELARTALWLEGFEEGVALSFLDHHLLCGDALIGLTDLNQLQFGIPDAAFKPLSGDDKAICKDIAKANKEALKAFAKLKTNRNLDIALDDADGLSELEKLEQLPDATTAEIAAKEVAYREFLQHAKDSRLGHAADLLVGAFLAPKADAEATSSTATSQNLYLELFTDQTATELSAVHQSERLATARQLCVEARVLHWPLAFPQVFAKGGFDCVLGNPPWERIKLQEEEFFATRNRHVAEAKNKAERSQRIDWLAQGILAQKLYPDLRHAPHECEAEQRLYQEFISARRTAEAASVFAHVKGGDGGRYPLTGVGDVNTYALFAETITQITHATGRAGFIVPSGLATDNTTKDFFGALVANQSLASFFEFENEGFFTGAGQGHMLRFALATVLGGENKVLDMQFLFQGKHIEELNNENRVFTLTPMDIFQVNPNTKTCPIFRSKMDADITKKVYMRVEILIKKPDGKKDGAGSNPWEISFLSMFHMSGDSHLFNTKEQLRFSKKMPLYEAKMISQYNHRHGDFSSITSGERPHRLPSVDLDSLANPDYRVMPFYWVEKSIVEERLIAKDWKKDWMIGWRDVTDARASARTVIASVVPRVGVVGEFPLVLANFPSRNNKNSLYAALLSNLNCIVFDYLARQKIGGIHLKFYILEQLPILSPKSYKEDDLQFIVPRVLELTYTAHDLQPWAQDLGYDGPPFTFAPERRAQLRAELDAWYAKAYGLARDELRYILNPADVMGDDYPSETFRVLRNNELKEFGEYRTGRLVLQEFDRMTLAEAKGVSYQSLLFPPPGQQISVSYSPQGILRDQSDAKLAGLLLSMIRVRDTLSRQQLDLALLIAGKRTSVDNQLSQPLQTTLTRFRDSGLFESDRLERIQPLLRYFEENRVIKIDRDTISALPNTTPGGVIIEADMSALARSLLDVADERLRHQSHPESSDDSQSLAKLG